MKGIIIVDIPVEESCEIDEYSMVADLNIYPLILTDNEDLNISLEHVDIRPMPEKYNIDRWTELVNEGLINTFKGYNICIDEISKRASLDNYRSDYGSEYLIIEEAKKDLIEATNIESSSDEMKVLNDFLRRCWQMGWLKKYEKGGENDTAD